MASLNKYDQIVGDITADINAVSIMKKNILDSVAAIMPETIKADIISLLNNKLIIKGFCMARITVNDLAKKP